MPFIQMSNTTLYIYIYIFLLKKEKEKKKKQSENNQKVFGKFFFIDISFNQTPPTPYLKIFGVINLPNKTKKKKKKKEKKKELK